MSRSCRLRGWLAVAVLLGFIGLCLLLTGWFGWTAHHLSSGALRGGPHPVRGCLGAIPALDRRYRGAWLDRAAVRHVGSRART